MTDVVFCSSNSEDIEKNIIETYEAAAGIKLYPADPVRILLQGLAYIIAHQREVINNACKQNLLRYATGEHLDALGEITGTGRIPESYASVTVKFHRAEGSKEVIFIIKGLRVTADGKIYFQTDEDALILQEDVSVTVKCTCLTAGEDGNGYKIGEINRIVDPVPYLSKVENITLSDGGHPTETDEAYRQRIYIAPESFSVAGPALAYQYHTKTADAEITDVAVLSPEPGIVKVYPLMINGEIPSDEILDRVRVALNSDKARPLTDFVDVVPPEQVGYEVNVTYYLYKNSEANHEKVTEAVNNYILWQKTKLGRDINPDKLKGELLAAGVKRTFVTNPQFVELKEHETAVCENINILFGGYEDE